MWFISFVCRRIRLFHSHFPFTLLLVWLMDQNTTFLHLPPCVFILKKLPFARGRNDINSICIGIFCIKLLEPVLMDRCDTNLANNESGFNDNSSNIYTSSIKNHEDKNLGINFNALQSSIYPKSNFLCITFFFFYCDVIHTNCYTI